MAVIGSSPVRSPAAAVNVSSTRWKHRSTSARNSAFLVGKSRNRYGWLIPARRATSSVEVPASPWTANSATAASSTNSRRSAAGIRCLVVTVMEAKLVTTHYFVKRAGEPGLRGQGGRGGEEVQRGTLPGRGSPVERAGPVQAEVGLAGVGLAGVGLAGVGARVAGVIPERVGVGEDEPA